MNLLFSLSPFGIKVFTEGPTIDTIVRSSIISDPLFRGVPLLPVKLYVIGLHFGTGIIGVNLTHFVNKRPIIHGVRCFGYRCFTLPISASARSKFINKFILIRSSLILMNFDCADAEMGNSTRFCLLCRNYSTRLHLLDR